MRFLGYRVESYKLFIFTLSACWPASPARLYVPQVGIINPGEMAPANSIEMAIWVAVGGRGTLIGAALGAFAGELREELLHGVIAPYWLFLLGALFILVTLLLPQGHHRHRSMRWSDAVEGQALGQRRSAAAKPASANPSGGVGR